MVDGLHAIVDVEHLPLAEDLASDGCGNSLVVVGTDVREDWVPILGSGSNMADLPNSGQRHLQGSRYRRCGQRKSVDRRTHRLDAILRCDPEALLFIDNEES